MESNTTGEYIPKVLNRARRFTMVEIVWICGENPFTLHQRSSPVIAIRWKEFKVKNFPGRNSCRIRWTFNTLGVFVALPSHVPDNNLNCFWVRQQEGRPKLQGHTLTRSGNIRYWKRASSANNMREWSWTDTITCPTKASREKCRVAQLSEVFVLTTSEFELPRRVGNDSPQISPCNFINIRDSHPKNFSAHHIPSPPLNPSTTAC